MPPSRTRLRAVPTATPPVALAPRGPRPIPAPRVVEIRAAQRVLIEAQVAVSNALVALRQAEAAVEPSKAALLATLADAAREMGIDLDDPTKGRWEVDLEAMSIVRVDG